MLICSNAKLVCFPYVCIPLLCLLEYWNKSNLKNLKKELISASLQFRMLLPENSLSTLYNSCPQSVIN